MLSYHEIMHKTCASHNAQNLIVICKFLHQKSEANVMCQNKAYENSRSFSLPSNIMS